MEEIAEKQEWVKALSTSILKIVHLFHEMLIMQIENTFVN